MMGRPRLFLCHFVVMMMMMMILRMMTRLLPNSMIYLKDDVTMGRLRMLVRCDKNKVVLWPKLCEVVCVVLSFN